MAIQAQLYPDSIIGGFGSGTHQDHWTMMMDNGRVVYSNNGGGGGGGGGAIGASFSDFCLDLQDKYQQLQRAHSHQLHQQQQRNPNLFLDSTLFFSPPSSKPTATPPQNANLHNLIPSSTTTTTMAFPSSHTNNPLIALHAEEHRHETDRLITLQNERLRLALQEQRRQLLATLLSKFESKALPVLKQKDEQIAQAAKRTAELENYLKKLDMESHAWEKAAREKEAMVMSLNHTLGELREKACNGMLGSSNGGEEMDAGSCCNMNISEEDEDQEVTGENRVAEEQRMRKMNCQVCNNQRSCVMLLPCRHLCSCKPCESLLLSCPICSTIKKASIEVLNF